MNRQLEVNQRLGSRVSAQAVVGCVGENSDMPVTLSVKHLPSDREQPCAVCGALFVPSEDSGSRVFSMTNAEHPPLRALMCGGCYSKWSHGTTVTIRSTI